MTTKGNTAKTNIITLDKWRVTPRKPTKKEVVDRQNDEVVSAFHDACIKISDKIDIKGYALVALLMTRLLSRQYYWTWRS